MDPEEEFPPRSKNHGKQVRWDKRDEGSEKYISNQRRMQYREFHIAELAYGNALHGGASSAELAILHVNVWKQYNKLFMVDHYNEADLDAKPTDVSPRLNLHATLFENGWKM